MWLEGELKEGRGRRESKVENGGGQAEEVGKGRTTQGLWLTGAFGSFLRIWGSSWVLNRGAVLKSVISEEHYLQNNTGHFAVMGMVCTLTAR